MEKHEMMSLEDSKQLRERMRFFEQELLKNKLVGIAEWITLV